MQNNDLKDLNTLWEISQNIRIVYQKLMILELQDEFNKDKYNKLISCLKELICLEDKIYENINFDIVKCKTWIDYIKSKFISKINTDKLLIDGNIEAIEYYRIYYTLNYIINSKINNLTDLTYLGAKIKQISFGQNSSMKEIDRLIFILSTLSNTFNEDYYSSFLMFLEEEIHNQIDINIKKELISRKYLVLYFNKFIEKLMLNYNYIIPEYMYSNSKMMSSLYEIPKNIHELNKNIYFFNNLDELINYYLNSNNNEAKERIIIECLIKSKIANISKENMKAIVDEIEKKLSYMINMSVIGDNAKKIIEILSNCERYQNRIRTITFGKTI